MTELAAAALPLAVDLDGTLVRTDTLVEQVVALAFAAPLKLAAALWTLRKGRAAFKQALAAARPLDAAHLPYDPAVVDLVRVAQAGGRQTFLVTAADQSIADLVAAHLGGFSGAKGTEPGRNLKGEIKARWLAERFPEGFAYVGDSPADASVFAAAREAIAVGPAARHARAPITALAVRPRAGWGDWIRALRLHQWSKNVLMFVPFILAQEFVVPAIDLKMLAGFVAFGCVASATYLLNDLADLAADRAHPTKHRRALASGLISIPAAIAVAVVLSVGGLIAAGCLSAGFLVVVLGYVVLTTLYSWRLKRELLVDLLVIGTLFLARVMMGTALGEIPASVWLCGFTLMIFVSMAAAKRHAAIVKGVVEGREVELGRAYGPGDTPITAALGLSTGAAAIVILLLYLRFEAGREGLYASPGFLYPIALILGAWLLRIWGRAHRGRLDEDPVVFALRDPVSWGHAAAVGVTWGCAVLISGVPS